MPRDLFISYSSMTTDIADAICYNLENNQINCWIAHRDILPGKEYAAAIIEGINECPIFLLVLSRYANESPQVAREVERAVSKNKKIIAFRLEDFPLSKSLEYALSNIHWLDAAIQPLEIHIQRLITIVREILPDLHAVNPVPTPVIIKDLRKQIRSGSPKNAYAWMMKTTNGPGRRKSFGMIYDNVKEEIILNGGFGPGVERGHFFSLGPEQMDTWAWNGSVWNVKNIKPLMIQNHALAFNKTTQQPTLFGGCTGNFRSDKTYILGGEEWVNVVPGKSPWPEARESHTLVYDENRKTLLLFGGLSVRLYSGQIPLGDTWEWDGSSWNKLDVNAPEARWGHKMVYDENNEAILLFGGYNGSKYFDDTWIWKGNQATWSKVTSKSAPSGRCSHGMTFNNLHQHTLLFGGQSDAKLLLNDLWKWDGEDWILLEEHTPPGSRYDAGFVYDINRNKTILFGGFDDKSFLQDTWELSY